MGKKRKEKEKKGNEKPRCTSSSSNQVPKMSPKMEIICLVIQQVN